MRTMTDDERVKLEHMMDACGTATVLLALAEICGWKSVHIAECWQDTTLAKRWDKLADEVGKVAPRAEGL